VNVLLEWWRDERRVWGLVGDVATNGYGDWRIRQRLLKKASDLRDDVAAAPGRAGFWSDSDDGQLSEDANSPEVDEVRDQLQAIGAELGNANGARGSGHDLEGWLEALGRAESRSRPLRSRGRRAAMCDHQAHLWRSLSEWLRPESDGSDAQLKRFQDRLKKASRARRRVLRRGRR
jgi:hypothetical protein